MFIKTGLQAGSAVRVTVVSPYFSIWLYVHYICML
jgi:hypothetical protein